MIEVDEFIDQVWRAACRGEIAFMGEQPSGRRWIEPPCNGKLLVLSPHPDDPDAVAVSLREFDDAGCRIRYAITGGAHGGMTDEYARVQARKAGVKPGRLEKWKAELRQREQIASARESGIVDGDVVFLKNVEEDELGDMREVPENARLVARLLKDEDPDMVMMPYGNDSNTGHRSVFNVFREVAPGVVVERGRPILALYNRDPKTISINEQLVVPFDGEAARWKASLLSLHDSQQQRNLEVRGYGLDERILRLNREIQTELQSMVIEPWKDECLYAESFQLELFG